MSDSSIISDLSDSKKGDGDQQAEYETLSQELAEKELELATLENELSIFEVRYARKIGVLFAGLDELEKKIAKELWRLNPDDKYQKNYQNAEKKAKASEDSIKDKIHPTEKKDFKPTDEIKNLYRKVAKTIHPDLATTEDERAFRTSLMTKANSAYKNGDKQTLEQILYEWDHRDEKSTFEEVEKGDAKKLEQKIIQIKIRIKEIEKRIENLKSSELYQLMCKVNQAEREGRDLLADMEKDLRRRIIAAQELLNSLKQQGGG